MFYFIVSNAENAYKSKIDTHVVMKQCLLFAGKLESQLLESDSLSGGASHNSSNTPFSDFG
jgi:hypothetical protein